MTYIRIRYEKQGGHFHCRLFTSQNQQGTYAKCGDLVFDEREFTEVVRALSRCEWLEEGISAPTEGRMVNMGPTQDE